MIAKILSNRGGSGGANTISYAFGQTDHKDEHEAAECEFLTSNLIAVPDPTTVIEKDEDSGLYVMEKIPTSEADLTPIIQQFEQMAAQNDRVQNPYFHAVLSFEKEDEAKIDNNIMAEIAEQFMTDMGFKDCGWIATVHRDTQHTHIHLAACTVQNNQGNTVVDAYNNYGRAMESCRQIEADFGLTEVHMPDGGSRMDGRQDRETAHSLRDIIDVCVEEVNKGITSPTSTTPSSITRNVPPAAESPLQNFVSKLNDFGVDVQFQFKEGRPTGISYSMNESSWSGGKLRGGGRFTLPGLEKRGIGYQESDKDFCEQVTTTSKENRSAGIVLTPTRFISDHDVKRPNQATGNYDNAEPYVLASAKFTPSQAAKINNSSNPPYYAKNHRNGLQELFWRTNIKRSLINTKHNNFDGIEALLKKIKRDAYEADKNDPMKQFKLTSRGRAPSTHSSLGDKDKSKTMDLDDEGKPANTHFLFGL